MSACVASPTDSARVLSRYGPRPGRTTGAVGFHAGVDFAAPTGTPVRAALGGEVELVAGDIRGRWDTLGAGSRFVGAGPLGGYGNAVVVRSSALGIWTLYAHLSRVDVALGRRVRPGELLGLAGASTNGKFPGMVAHLHLEVRVAGPGGRSPFPGPYRRHNIDPLRALRAMGLAEDRGRLVVRGACDVAALARVTGIRRDLAAAFVARLLGWA